MSLDDKRRPQAVPPLELQTDDERKRFDAGMKRYQLRKERRVHQSWLSASPHENIFCIFSLPVYHGRSMGITCILARFDHDLVSFSATNNKCLWVIDPAWGKDSWMFAKFFRPNRSRPISRPFYRRHLVNVLKGFFMLHDCKQDTTFLGQWTILSGQNGVILPAQVANHAKDVNDRTYSQS